MSSRDRQKTLTDTAIDTLILEAQPRRMLPNLTAGIIAGLFAIVLITTFGALIFSGELGESLPQGISLLLVGGIAGVLVMTLFSSIPTAFWISQDTAAAVGAVVVASVVASLPASVSAEARFTTVVATIALSSILTGVFFLLLGTFKLGELIRFVPYPVVGGFLAGTGWVLVRGGLGVMTGLPMSLADLPALIAPDMLLRWLPGLLFGLLVFMLTRRLRHYLLWPAMIIGMLFAFYLVLLVTGTTIDVATAQGLLVGDLGGSGEIQLLTPAALSDVRWGAVAMQAGGIASFVTITALGLLLNAASLELAARRDLDLNRELRSAGFANIAAGLLGGLAGYHAISLTALAERVEAKSRTAGLVVVGTLVLAVFGSDLLIARLPLALMGGLLLYIGMDFLKEWLYDGWFRLPLTDYVMQLLIMLVIASVGFLEGVGVGLVGAAILFIVSYSRVNVVRHTLTGQSIKSNVDRPARHSKILDEQGDEIYVLKLQGFLFFGTANRLLQQVQVRIETSGLPDLRYAVFDMKRVSGMDSSVSLSLQRLAQMAQDKKFSVVLTGLDSDIMRQLGPDLTRLTDDNTLRLFESLDYALEWCENDMLRKAMVTERVETGALREQLSMFFPPSVDPELLVKYMKRQTIDKGEYLIHQGDEADTMYFLESGIVTIELENEDGTSLRLRTLEFGNVVGEMGLYLDQRRTASVIASFPCVVYQLTRESMNEMKASHPELAAAFHEFIAARLAERLTKTNMTLQTVLD